MSGKIIKSKFGNLPDGSAVEQFTLSGGDITCKIINYGGIITELHTPDKNGKDGDVVLGFDNFPQYLTANKAFFGTIVGRFANRIAKGKFTLDGKTYSLAINNGPNHLHGGLKGFDKVAWKAVAVESKDAPALKLSYISPDGQENYPGTLKMLVTYTVTDKNEVRIDYEAETDQATLINLTNHSYFNLAGSGDVMGHELMVNAKEFTPSDDTLIPTGEIKSVQGTALDFTEPKAIGRHIGKLLDQPHRGYDHNFVLNNDGKMVLAARVFEPKSGRVMEVLTDQPGIQLYTGNFLEETRGKGGSVYGRHGGFCLETQHFPDSVNHPNFPSTILRPGEKYRTTTVHRFSVG
ncbi:MAG TPA: aldose epimerase family protein [Verrucomicrobiae bacterium]|jgi:aldose 1-epimerase|nr:aldose epimerase family protein [Verrucomicrobiae bacterium]